MYYVCMKKTVAMFDQENNARKQIEFSGRKLPEVKIWQIRRYYVGINIWQEISKSQPFLRPCIILTTISSTSLVKIIPLSSKYHKKRSKYYLLLVSHQKYYLKKSWLLLHQSQIVDKKRLIKIQSKKIIPSSFISQLNDCCV